MDFRQPSSEFLVQKDRVLILPALAALMLVWMEFPPWVQEGQTRSHFKIPTQRQRVRIPLIPFLFGGCFRGFLSWSRVPIAEFQDSNCGSSGQMKIHSSCGGEGMRCSY